jgi:hypothetical protein
MVGPPSAKEARMYFNFKEDWLALLVISPFVLGIGYIIWYNIRAWFKEKAGKKGDKQ